PCDPDVRMASFQRLLDVFLLAPWEARQQVERAGAHAGVVALPQVHQLYLRLLLHPLELRPGEVPGSLICRLQGRDATGCAVEVEPRRRGLATLGRKPV